jgi:pilus assembly protein Flp/PilA
MQRLRNIFTNRSGATGAEYAMLLAIVGAAIIVASIGLSGAIANEMNDATSNIEP